MSLQKVNECARALAGKKLNIAFLESATAGRMCAEFAMTPESGKILRGGISCYEVFVKKQILNVPEHLIQEFTPESAEVTQALAESGARLLEADVTVAVTGLTTPGGSETPEKPVGTMFLHIICRGEALAHREVFHGGPEAIVLDTISRAAELVTAIIGKTDAKA